MVVADNWADCLTYADCIVVICMWLCFSKVENSEFSPLQICDKILSVIENYNPSYNLIVIQ